MIEITKNGRDEKTRYLEKTIQDLAYIQELNNTGCCSVCGSAFRYSVSDIKNRSDDLENTNQFIKCPYCESKVRVCKYNASRTANFPTYELPNINEFSTEKFKKYAEQASKIIILDEEKLRKHRKIFCWCYIGSLLILLFLAFRFFF